MTRQTRLRLNKVYAGLSDFARNFGLLFVAAPLVDPLINPSHSISIVRVIAAVAFGLVLLGISLILAWMQKD
ncbi:MAG: hypothetical protein JNJ73_16010 [Hyphomonadaceae bacterium]|nr:hypothetical protein [Hyphomonadaceae bacterium]